MAGLSINRNQLASFIKDPETLRRFENLFTQAGTITPEQITLVIGFIQDSDITSATYGAAAEVAQAKSAFDYLDFDQYQLAAAKVGRLSWSAPDKSLALDLGSFRQKLGQDVAELITNGGASAMPAGAVIGVDGTGSMVRFIADGSMPAQNIVGVCAETINPGEQGLVTVQGGVSGLATNTWPVGTILYASATTAGALTSIRPSSPALVVPVARVTVTAPGTDGKISVRPVVTGAKAYGQFIKSSSQPPSAINTPTAVLWTGSPLSGGVDIGTPASRIVAAVDGAYRVSSSARFQSAAAAASTAWLWLRVNGADIADSATSVSIDPGATATLSVQSIVGLGSGGYVELIFAATDVGVTLEPIAAPAFAPAVPAATLSATLES